VDIKARGLAAAPEIAIGDGAMGFWRALDEVFAGTRHQRCWQHKAANVPGKGPRSVQPGMKADLREVRDAPDRATARAAVAVFAEKYQAKYPKAVECLIKDQDAPLTLLDFPAEHSHDRRQCFPRGRSAGGAHRA
jgi:transposase-like protein